MNPISIQEIDDYIKKCTDDNVAVIGVDFFVMQDGKKIDQAGKSIDFSSVLEDDGEWKDIVLKCNEEVIKIISDKRKINPALLCELVVKESKVAGLV